MSSSCLSFRICAAINQSINGVATIPVDSANASTFYGASVESGSYAYTSMASASGNDLVITGETGWVSGCFAPTDSVTAGNVYFRALLPM
jgi:hypothetical protein